MLNTQSNIVEKFNLNFYSVSPDEPPISVTINLTKAEIAYNSLGSDLINYYEIHFTNFYNNNLILIVYRWWSTKYIQWLLWLQYNRLQKYKVTIIFTDELTQPVACRAIATRWLSAKRLVVRSVLISHDPKLKSRMRTDAKSGYTRWLQN